MTYPPGIGKTPNDWREEEARRVESRERVHNPHGRAPSPRTRRVIAWLAALILAGMAALTILGLIGVLPVFAGP